MPIYKVHLSSGAVNYTSSLTEGQLVRGYDKLGVKLEYFETLTDTQLMKIKVDNGENFETLKEASEGIKSFTILATTED